MKSLYGPAAPSVFPTGVGMNRVVVRASGVIESVPHGRGDEPAYGQMTLPGDACVPHGRGDEPLVYRALVARDLCSPRAWG